LTTFPWFIGCVELLGFVGLTVVIRVGSMEKGKDLVQRAISPAHYANGQQRSPEIAQASGKNTLTLHPPYGIF
jgi:hypothetical protein